MITLQDIDAMFPGEHRGAVYSDLYKEAYSIRPRGTECQFSSVKDFERAFDSALVALDREQEREVRDQQYALECFEKRIVEVLAIMPRATKADAIRILMQTQNISEDDVACYGLEFADYEFGLKYGTIGRMMEAA